MKKYVQPATFAALVGAACLPLACGSKSSNLGQVDAGGDDATAGSTSSSGGVSSGGSSGSTGEFTHPDSAGGGMGTGVCQTGMYSGSFSCGFYQDPDAGTTAPMDGGSAEGGILQIMGTLSFLLTQSTSGELGQDMASGTFVIGAGFFVSGMATLAGTLDCASGLFTGMLANGTYSVFFGLLTGTFDGPLTSDYNGKTFSFVDGVWSLTIPGEGYCQGQWNADYVGDAGASDQ
jgi:hypothetical protein